MDPGSEAPRLGLIEILQGISGDSFASGRPTVQKPKLTLDFSRARLMLKLLYQHPSFAILRYFVLLCVGKPADKKDDVDVCTNRLCLHKCNRKFKQNEKEHRKCMGI